MIDINDYLIDQSEKDWAELLKPWVPPLPAEFTMWMVNRFGDAIVFFEDGSVHMLDVGAQQVSRLADSRDDFIAKVNDDATADNWFMISLTNACAAAGMCLEPDQCYSFKIPPVLGGAYDVENVGPCDLAETYAVSADIHRQIKDLPDGAKVKFVITD